MSMFNLGSVPPITFGPGQISRTPDIVATLGGGPALIIADRVLADMGVVDRLVQDLAVKGVPSELAAEVAGEPRDTLVDDLCDRAREGGARVVIGLGGGSAMDAAKLVAAIAPSGAPARSFALAKKPFPAEGLPAIAIPTTAGTGSEVTRTSIVSTPHGVKIWYYGEALMFAHAVLDPELTLSLPPHLTAWTGIDAVAHAIEGVTARGTNPAGQLYGLEALRILAIALPRAVADGADIESRAHVLWGSTLAGLALHNCNTHMGHNISHALGSLVAIHHGLATGLALEVILPWLVAHPEGADAYALVALALGSDARASKLPAAMSDLMRACQIPPELPAVCRGVTAASLAAQMQAPANRGMSENAACPVTNADLKEMASSMLALPVATNAA